MNHSGLHRGGHHTSTPSSTTQHLARRKQINTLRIFNENVIETRQDVEFQMSFDVTGPLTLVMLILLQRDFPAGARPTIRVIPKDGPNAALQHPWINEANEVVGSPGLNSFRSSMTDLGRVVQAIKREFEKNPPVVLADSATASSRLTHRAATKQKSLSPPESSIKSMLPPTELTLTASRSIPEIEELSQEQLEELKKDPVAFGVFYRKLEVATMTTLDGHAGHLKKEIQSLLDSSNDCNSGRSLTEELEDKKQLFLERKQEFHSICQTSRDKVELLKSTMETLDTFKLCDNLSIASQTDELESDKCAEAFLAGDMPLDDFLADYVNIRTRHHIRKSKVERFATVTDFK